MATYQKQTVAQYSPYDERDDDRFEEAIRTNTPYKGLSTSITHMFADPATARIDCCAIACGGILQSDYNRYILLGKRPPTFKHRVLQHLLVPLSFFCTAGYCAVTIQNHNTNQLFSTFFVFLCLAWIIGGCFRSGYKRWFFRRALLKKIVEQQHGVIVTESEDEDDDQIMVPQTDFEMTCAHRACGYLRNDYTTGKAEFDGEGEDEVEGSRDLCGCLFKTFSDSCCGKIFGCHFQICGICALAQEGRQLDSMVHIDKRRMDYVSFQYFTDYFNLIRKLRDEKDGNLLNHYKALSKLSRMILKTLGFTIFVVFLFSVSKLADRFRLGNLLVFLATFLQAFLILYIVHWRLHRFDLSLDAVIKYFAAGFILSITSALFFESVISLVLQLVLLIIIPPQVANNDGGYGQFSEYRPYFTFIEHSPWNMYADEGDTIAFHRQHPFISTILLILNAYVVAALVEELSKYFGFIMVEHPDFLCDSELQAAAEFSACDGEEDYSVAGGDESEEDSVAEVGVGDSPCVSLTFESGGLNCAGGGNLNCAGGGTRFDCAGREGLNCEGGELNKGMASENRQISKRFLGEKNADVEGNGMKQQRVELHPAPPRSSSSVGAGITVAMVSVALGFACCENLIYIFLYHGDSLGSEIGVLIFRSLFPVHPLCAAIQSIGVCKQQLENDRSIQLGSIIIPSIVLHGSYDFVIMFLSFVTGIDNGGNGGGLETTMSLILSITIVMVGWIYYIKEGEAQTVRLNQMDSARNFVGISV